MTRKMTREQAKFLSDIKKSGYSAIYNEWFRAVQVKVSTISIESLKLDLDHLGYASYIRPAPELGQFQICNDPSISGRDVAAYLMVL